MLVAVNPRTVSSLPFLLLVPHGGGMLLATAGTWPRERSLYCQPLPAWRWPRSPELVDRAGVLSCERRGSSIELVLNRRTRSRSRLVFTTARGREMVFWQSAQVRGHYPERTALPASAAAGPAAMEIIADTRECATGRTRSGCLNPSTADQSRYMGRLAQDSSPGLIGGAVRARFRVHLIARPSPLGHFGERFTQEGQEV
jgi:hypothetical protein